VGTAEGAEIRVVGQSQTEGRKGEKNLTDTVGSVMELGLTVEVEGLEGRVEGRVEGNLSGNSEEGVEPAVVGSVLRYD